MSCVYETFFDGRLVVEYWTGDISHAELIDHEKQQLQDTSITPGAVILSDSREARFPETSLDIVIELTDCYKDPANKTSLRKVAQLVAKETTEQEEIYEVQAQMHDVTIIAFDFLRTACIWLAADLGVSPEDIERCLDEVRSGAAQGSAP